MMINCKQCKEYERSTHSCMLYEDLVSDASRCAGFSFKGKADKSKVDEPELTTILNNIKAKKQKTRRYRS